MSDDKKTQAINMLKKIVSSIKKDSQFLKDVVVDQSGLKKIELKIEESQCELDQVKTKMTMLLQKELQSTRKIKILRHRMVDQESQVVIALSDEDEQQAMALATELAATELEYQNQLQLDESFKLSIQDLQSEMEYAERQQKELERQLSMVDTTKRIHRASDVIVKSLYQIDNKQLSAKESLQRIRDKQLHREKNQHYEKDILPAKKHTEYEGAAVKVESAADVLKRLRDK